MKLFGISFFECKQQKRHNKMNNFGIQETLQQLGVTAINNGTSTGIKNFSNGEIIESYSPARF